MRSPKNRLVDLVNDITSPRSSVGEFSVLEIEHDYEEENILDSDDEDEDEEEISSLVPTAIGGLFRSSSSSCSSRNSSSSHRRISNCNNNKQRKKYSGRWWHPRHACRKCFNPYLPLYLSATAVVVILAAILVFVPSSGTLGDGVLVSSHEGTQFSCVNSSDVNSGIDKLLNRVDSMPQKERCIVMPGHKGCACQNPIQGKMPNEENWNASWQKTFTRNQELVASISSKLDIVLLGDSITEAWQGTSQSIPKDKFAQNHIVYKNLFDSLSSPLKGLALGISGDRCTQLLYRIQQNQQQGRVGELSNLVLHDISPMVFWILIGTNDFLWDACHVDQIVAGNIQIVRQLLDSFPQSTVVVQSLLPVDSMKDIDFATSWKVYTDINEQLFCYAASERRVEFVNVTQLFLSSGSIGEVGVNRTMLPDGLHPGGVAAQVWGELIVSTVQLIIHQNRTSP